MVDYSGIPGDSNAKVSIIHKVAETYSKLVNQPIKEIVSIDLPIPIPFESWHLGLRDLTNLKGQWENYDKQENQEE